MSPRLLLAAGLSLAAFAHPTLAADPPIASPGLQAPQAPATKPATTEKDQAAREEAFGKLMSGATLEGQFTARDRGDGKLPAAEKYTLGKVTKLKDDLWNFETRIQYGGRDVTVPLALRVVWSGDTPVITLDDLAIPGMGSFTCRVMIFNNQYAGMWDGKNNHGGLLFGKVIAADAKKVESKEAPKTETKGTK
ncbi:MAG: hypothetical protein QM811_25630 [Pirellulales bacterium]